MTLLERADDVAEKAYHFFSELLQTNWYIWEPSLSLVTTVSFRKLFTGSMVPVALLTTCPAELRGYETNNLTWTDGAVRMNHIQVVGTHNSYHVQALPSERSFQKSKLWDAEKYWYTHPPLEEQFDINVRSFELDVLADPEGGNYATPAVIRKGGGSSHLSDPAYDRPGTKVLHIPDFDVRTTCTTLVSCLLIIKNYLQEHPNTVPIPINIEFKTAHESRKGGAKRIKWTDAKLLNTIDEEIRSVFPPEMMVSPDDLKRRGLTLEQSVTGCGWPDLDSARGRVFFFMDNEAESMVRTVYKAGRPNLEGRTIFTNSKPGQSDCAVQKLNEPIKSFDRIQKQVKAGYIVRTRSDIGVSESRGGCKTARREHAFRSGAQIVSTDYELPDTCGKFDCEYMVELEGGRPARCNPVNAPEGCVDADLEPAEYQSNSG